MSMVPPSGQIKTAGDETELLGRAKALLRLRRLQDQHFAPSLTGAMGDPIYQMLIELYVAHRTGKTVNVTGACLASGVAVTTGLRILNHMTHAGAVHLFADRNDRRQRLVELTARMIATIERYLRALEPIIAKGVPLDGAQGL